MPSTPTLRTEMSEFQDNALCTQAYSPGSGSPTSQCGSYPDSGGNNDGGITQMKADAAMVFKTIGGMSVVERTYIQIQEVSLLTLHK